MYAWRRANVTAVNTRARQAMATAGKLAGPELKVDGQTFQTGDRIVTLAPGAGGQTVTSERGSVVTVHPAARSLAARMDDGRTQVFGPDDLGGDRLALGYATTVHRSQGSTVDVAHLFADGGGRELGYVGMSRARQTSHVHVVADNPGQAVEDLVRDWSAERRQIWAIDTGTPQPVPVAHPLEVEASGQTPAALKAALGRARLAAERHALVSNLKAAAGAEGIDNLPGPAVERVQLLDRHIKNLDRQLTAQQQRPTPGVVRVPPAYQPHHAPPPPRPGGPTPGM